MTDRTKGMSIEEGRAALKRASTRSYRNDGTRQETKGAMSPEARRVADDFFDYKKKHPGVVAEKDMTPLQRRMQSGGATPNPGVTREQSEKVLANLHKSKFKIPRKLLDK